MVPVSSPDAGKTVHQDSELATVHFWFVFICMVLSPPSFVKVRLSVETINSGSGLSSSPEQEIEKKVKQTQISV